jgi:hypothetical protein
MKHFSVKLSVLVLSVFIMYQFTFTQTSFNKQIILYQTENHRPYSVFPADLDGDGDMDVLSAFYIPGKIVWFANMDGQGMFGNERIITTETLGAQSAVAADLDNDGDMDVLSASEWDDKIAWYENLDGLGSFGAQHVITTEADGVKMVHSADLDCDGDADVLSSFKEDKIVWYANTDGHGAFGTYQAITDSAVNTESVYVADLDGDGDMDVLSGHMHLNPIGSPIPFEYRISWYENTDGAGNFGSEQVIHSFYDFAECIFTADLDNDGDMDVLTAEGAKIAWYKNINSEGTFSSEQVITTEVESPICVHAADLDNDGDLDVLSASQSDDKIAWYENDRTKVLFGPQQVISISADGAHCVCAADLDGDGDMDVISASEKDGKIAWYRNLFTETTIQDEHGILPDALNLSQNYPNPFNAVTTICFTLPRACFVTLKVYDLRGRVIGTLVNERKAGGMYSIIWDAETIPGGIYLYRLKTEAYIATKKMILQK